jgi:hypothetical protein
MHHLTKIALSVFSTLVVSSAFAQCPGNGPCPYRQSGYSNQSYRSGPSYEYSDQTYYNAPSNTVPSYGYGYSEQSYSSGPSYGYRNQPYNAPSYGYDRYSERQAGYYEQGNRMGYPGSQGSMMNRQHDMNQGMMNSSMNNPGYSNISSSPNTTSAPTSTDNQNTRR